MKNRNVVVIGGGTGTYTVLSGLKKYPVNLTAIVSMADDGGSTGVLRDELGVLPPGDVRQCLVALSRSDRTMRELMNYRFANGGLKGHSFGNILLSALEKMSGSFDKAVERASEILRLEGKVIPATLIQTRLFGYFKNGRKPLLHEREFHVANLSGLVRVALHPRAKANPKAIAALKKAHVIVMGPGNFYSSLVPNLLVDGIPEAIRQSKAKKIFICNLMTQEGHTAGWSVADFAKEMERYLKGSFDYVAYNNRKPAPSLMKKYALKKENPVAIDADLPKRFMGADLVNTRPPTISENDPLRKSRTLIRHNPDTLAKLILSVI